MKTTSSTRSLWRVLFLAERYGRITLTLDEVADQIGLAPGTIRNRRTRGEFTWLRTDGRTLTADAAELDGLCHGYLVWDGGRRPSRLRVPTD